MRALQELHKRRLTEQREERQRLIESEIRSKNEYWLKEISRQLESKVSLEYSTINIVFLYKINQEYFGDSTMQKFTLIELFAFPF